MSHHIKICDAEFLIHTCLKSLIILKQLISIIKKKKNLKLILSLIKENSNDPNHLVATVSYITINNLFLILKKQSY